MAKEMKCQACGESESGDDRKSLLDKGGWCRRCVELETIDEDERYPDMWRDDEDE